MLNKSCRPWRVKVLDLILTVFGFLIHGFPVQRLMSHDTAAAVCA